MKSKPEKTTIIFSHIFSIIISSGITLVSQLFLKEKDNNIQYIISTIILLLLYLLGYRFLSRKYRKRKKILKENFPTHWREILESSVYYYTVLGPEEKIRFEKKIQIFLGEKIITGIETDVNEKLKILVAASAIIPVFKIPGWEYDRLDEILIYPKNFDENFDFAHENKAILGMVISNTSTVILSKPALIQSFAQHNDSFNVGIHEFVHKIDGEDGVIDGVPALLIDKKLIPKYLTIIERESEKIESGDSDINSYALTNRIEFFAVVSEYFFENPEKMREKHPELYSIMSKIYKQDLVALFKSAFSAMFGIKKKIGRNDPCPCGSGQKYKQCCLNKKINH